MMRHLAGKVVALTGAASGIGRALAIRLAAEGAELALADIDGNGLARTAELAARSPKVTTHVVDVADRAAVEVFALAAEHQHRGVDILVSNAGVGCVATLVDTSYVDFEWVLNVDLWGVIHGVKAFLPLLRTRPEAQIVNVASVNSFVPFPTSGPYNVAKAGVAALTDTLRMELSGTSISVACVYPGGVRTSIARSARHTTDDDAAGFERRALTTPDRAARLIVRGMKHDRKRIIIGPDARVLALAARTFPLATQRLVTWGWRRIEQRKPAGGARAAGGAR